MTPIELMQAGKLHYFDDEEIQALTQRAQELTARFNAAAANDDEARAEILQQLLGKIEGWCLIKPPFHCDYGKFIEIGDGTFLNYDCIILDASPVKIGRHVFIGPRTCIYTASHPIDAAVRIAGYDISKPVTIGDNVWIGGNVVVNPGVTIGENSIIGSGSVVTKDIPSNVIAAGNPCRVIREITDDDKRYWEAQRDEFLQSQKGAEKEVMTQVKFYDEVDDSLLKFAVIIAKSGGKWVFCQHRERDTYEIAGGHREAGEAILDTAKRELYEETGALKYELKQICVYSVTAPDNFDGRETFGMLYFADITQFEGELHSEIETVLLTEKLPSKWTYPAIQPKLLEHAAALGYTN